MIDLSEESLHENIEICSKYTARMAKMGMTRKSNWAALAVKKTAWITATWTLPPCTQPEDVDYAYTELSKSARVSPSPLPSVTYGVYKPVT